MNFFQSIEAALKSEPERELLATVDGNSYSRADILSEAAKLANYMVSIGVKPGDRVSVQVHKSVFNLSLYLACIQGGFVFHPLNPAYQSNELKYFISNAEPTLIVCDPEKYGTMRALAVENGIDNLETLDGKGEGSLVEKSLQHSSTFETVSRSKEDIAALLYSSGTTGQPKGIMLSHENLRSNAQCLVDAWQFSDKDRLLHLLPIFHVHGLFVALGCILLSGGSMRWAEKFTPAYVKTYLQECTTMMGVPTFYTRLLSDKEFSKHHCQKIRLFTSGSAPLLVETFNEFRQLTGLEILERYGMTETGMNCSNPLVGRRQPGTVGPALPGVTVRVVDEQGENVELGIVGDLQVKGANVFKGYWRLPEKTKEDFTADGFLNTGDQATMDSDGYVSIVGRSKDMVITGGLNVYPKEVEGVIDQISGVKESAVIGVHHPDFGEAVVAVVVPEGGAHIEPKSIMGYASERLANFKVPKSVKVIDALPRNTMSKVQKKALRELFKDLFVKG